MYYTLMPKKKVFPFIFVPKNAPKLGAKYRVFTNSGTKKGKNSTFSPQNYHKMR